MVLSVSGLSKTYGKLQAINKIDINIEKGQVYGLLGPNGSGKTTTLSIILGVIQASSGSYTWFNRKPSIEDRRKIGALLEKPNFCPWLSAERNLLITASIKKIADPHKKIFDALAKVDLQNSIKQKFGTFSLGMKQRLAIASVILGDPEVLIFDEPTNGVDVNGIIEIRNIILNIAKEGKTIILASHYLDEVEKICSHMTMLRKGEVIESGAIKDLLSGEETVEIASENLDDLSDVLKDCPLHTSHKKNNDIFEVKLAKDTSISQFNEYLREKKITLTRLSTRKETLEAHFLSLLGKGDEQTNSSSNQQGEV